MEGMWNPFFMFLKQKVLLVKCIMLMAFCNKRCSLQGNLLHMSKGELFLKYSIFPALI